MITFRLNTHSGVPPYLQIVQQVKQALRMGILQEGDQLPTVKEVVAMVAINPNTVFKAYRELESQGLVEGRTGSGTFALQPPAGPSPETQAALAKDLSRWVAKAADAGLDDEAVEALVREVLHNKKGAK
ncbi:MAG TPA: GntR family transcriptional regulator [Patescibacteria group bacterium]|nr:GntR family transcriptional regulator [Patescibacteria group bacterium]